MLASAARAVRRARGTARVGYAIEPNGDCLPGGRHEKRNR